MDNALAFLFFTGLVFLVLAWPRLTSKQRLTRRVYRHVDETLGARKWENDRRATRRRVMRMFSRNLADLFYPTTQLGGAAVLPGARRIRRYITVHWTSPGPRWPRPWRVWHIDGVQLRWTSEAGANAANFVEWLERGKPTTGGGLAQALGLKWSSNLFEHTTDYARSAIVFRRTRAERVPERIDAGEDLGEFADDR